MATVQFPNWPEVLDCSPLPPKLKASFSATIRWYLSFCRRGRAQVDTQSARDFITWATQSRTPQPWQLEQWKEAIRWFFRSAKEPPPAAAAPPPTTARVEEERIWLPESHLAWPEWKVACVTMLRRRK